MHHAISTVPDVYLFYVLHKVHELTPTAYDLRRIEGVRRRLRSRTTCLQGLMEDHSVAIVLHYENSRVLRYTL